MMDSQSMTGALTNILAFQPVHERLATSGQPTLDQFALIAEAGFNTVINLALTDASNAIVGEDRRVLALGMDYVQLPLLFDHPSVSQALRVLTLLDQLKAEKVWLHCALNMRVSSLMYLYRTCYLGFEAEAAQSWLHQIWTPNETWSALITDAEHHLLNRQSLC